MKKIISMALICAILFSAGLTSNINAAESVKSTESKLKANQSEQKELDEKINDLNEKIKKVEGNIDSANEKMEKLDEESESLQKDIKKLKMLNYILKIKFFSIFLHKTIYKLWIKC